MRALPMRLFKISAKYILTAVCVVLVLNIPMTTRYGVNGVLFTRKIPLYAKACGFFYRDWMYRDIVNDIVRGKKDGSAKAVAILDWTNKNITCEIPPGIKVVDDHPLNIIIRQYGAKDQIEDIFTILCSYAGMKAGRVKCHNPDRTRYVILSLVKADGEWLIFDAANNKYFFNKKGGVGSVEDYLKGDLALSDKDEALYGQFLKDLKNKDFLLFTRAEEQMPLRRFPAQFKKMYNRSRDAHDD